MGSRVRGTGILIAILGAGLEVQAFDLPIHSNLTTEVLKALDFGGSALFEIVNSNACVDVGPVMRDDDEYCLPDRGHHDLASVVALQFYTPYHHFDNEKIQPAAMLVTALTRRIGELVRAGKYLQARKKLGIATHALQDFYAHTNWVELGQRVPFADASGGLRFSLDASAGAGTIRPAGEGEKVCGDNPYELLNTAASTGKLLTSGYFSDANKAVSDALKWPPGKCAHGLPALDGINKDNPGSLHGKMTRPGEGKSYHRVALDLATQHTRMYIESVLAAMDNEESRIMFKSALMEVDSKQLNQIPTQVREGDEWHFNVPSVRKLGVAPGSIVFQEITWGYSGLLPGRGQPLKAGPAGADGNYARTSLIRPVMPGEKVGALIGLLQPECPSGNPNDEACKAKPFLIGAGANVTMEASGTLYLLVNDTVRGNNSGSFEVEFTLWNRRLQP